MTWKFHQLTPLPTQDIVSYKSLKDSDKQVKLSLKMKHELFTVVRHSDKKYNSLQIKLQNITNLCLNIPGVTIF